MFTKSCVYDQQCCAENTYSSLTFIQIIFLAATFGFPKLFTDTRGIQNSELRIFSPDS